MDPLLSNMCHLICAAVLLHVLCNRGWRIKIIPLPENIDIIHSFAIELRKRIYHSNLAVVTLDESTGTQKIDAAKSYHLKKTRLSLDWSS